MLIMAAVAAVLVFFALRSTRSPSSEQALDALGSAVLPELDVNAVETITISAPSSTTTVTRGESQWTIQEKFNYPASFAKVRDVLIDLMELTVSDRIDVDPGRRADLGIAPVSDPQGGTEVSLSGTDGRVLAKLLLGNERQRPSQTPGGGYPDGRYVSPDGGENIYLVSDTLFSVSAKPIDWIETELLSVQGADLQSVSVIGSGREPVSLTQQGESGELSLAELAENEEADASRLSSLQNALSYLNAQDLADPALGDKETGMADPVVYTAVDKKGITYVLQVGIPEGETVRYLRIQTSFNENDSLRQQALAEDASEEDTTALAAELKEADERAKELNAKLGKWTYIIPDYKAESLLVMRSDLVKEKEEPEEDAADAPAEAASAEAITGQPPVNASQDAAPEAPAGDLK